MVQTDIQTLSKNDEMLKDDSVFKGQAQWFTELSKQHTRLKEIKDKEQDEASNQKVKDIAYLNPNFRKEDIKVSVETKLCINELLALKSDLA